MPEVESPQMSPVEAAMHQRISAKVAADPDILETQRFDFISIIMEVLTALLSACMGPTPDALAKTLKNPGWFARKSIRRQLRRAAAHSKKFADSYEAGEKGADILDSVAADSTHAELVEFVKDGRGNVIPDDPFVTI